jgi:hypothetical protein
VINFDFEIETMVSVEAAKKTNPDTLMRQATQLFVERLQQGEIEPVFTQTFDSSTGAYTVKGMVRFEMVDPEHLDVKESDQ